MSATIAEQPTTMSVEIDEAIRAKPELFEAVQAAQTYLEENYAPPEYAALHTAPRVAWEWKPNGSEFPIRCRFEEEADLGVVAVDDRYKPSQLLDVKLRNFLVLGSIRNILKERRTLRSVIIKKLLHQLDAEEANGFAGHG